MTYILEYGFPKTYIYIIYTSHWLWINDKKHDRYFLYLWKTAFRNIQKNLRKWSFAFLALPFRGKFIALAGWLSLLILLLLLFIIIIIYYYYYYCCCCFSCYLMNESNRIELFSVCLVQQFMLQWRWLWRVTK